MKKYHILLPLLSVVFLFSCDKYLDVNPDNRADVDNKTKIAGILVSAYPDNSYCYLAETSSDNIDRIDRFLQDNNRQHEEFFYWKDATEVGNDSPQTLWESFYKAIASANHALAAIEKLGNADGSLNPEKGEALLCRAYGHFVLVNLFCKNYGKTSESDMGIPYIDAPETTVSPKYERGTVAGVYAKIETDIEEALPLIRDDGYTVPKYHFNRKAAYAFAARFFLYYRKYDKVISYASEVLGSDPLTALRDWRDAGSSSVYEIRGNAFVNTDNKANLLLQTSYGSWGYFDGPYNLARFYMHTPLLSGAETDASAGPWGAGSTFFFRPVNLALGRCAPYKMRAFFEYTDQVQGIGYRHYVHPVFTSDETLLCRAEAYVLKNDFDNATKDLSLFMKNYSSGTTLNQTNIQNFYNGIKYYDYGYDEVAKGDRFAVTVKKRLNPDFTIVSIEQENFLHCVLHIRRILTRGEGLRWFDIKRYGIEIYRRAISENNLIYKLDFLPVDDPRRALQLPMDVINAGLPKNPRNNDQ